MKRIAIIAAIGLIVQWCLWAQDARSEDAIKPPSAMIEFLAQTESSAFQQYGPAVAITAMFLGYLLKLNAANNKKESKWLESLEKIDNKCHEHGKELTKTMTECIDRNTVAMIESAGSRKG